MSVSFTRENCKTIPPFRKSLLARPKAEVAFHKEKFKMLLRESEPDFEGPSNFFFKEIRGKKEDQREIRYGRYRVFFFVKDGINYFHWIGIKSDAQKYIKRIP